MNLELPSSPPNFQMVTLDEQALIKAYSPHDLRSVGISNTCEFNTEKMSQFIQFQHGHASDFYGKWSLHVY